MGERSFFLILPIFFRMDTFLIIIKRSKRNVLIQFKLLLGLVVLFSQNDGTCTMYQEQKYVLQVSMSFITANSIQYFFFINVTNLMGLILPQTP